MEGIGYGRFFFHNLHMENSQLWKKSVPYSISISDFHIRLGKSSKRKENHQKIIIFDEIHKVPSEYIIFDLENHQKGRKIIKNHHFWWNSPGFIELHHNQLEKSIKGKEKHQKLSFLVKSTRFHQNLLEFTRIH